MSGRPAFRLRALKDDCRGATIVEFALIAPVLLVTMLGVFDIGYTIYSTTLLEGAIQKAARDSTIQGAVGREAAIDARVTHAVEQIVPNAAIEFDRRAYAQFSDVARPEDFTDVNEDGLCSSGEPFEDVNGNGTWDADRGSDGFGGARDAVLYTVTVTYPRAFPFLETIGMDPEVTTVAHTVLRNQPYGLENHAVTVGNCT